MRVLATEKGGPSRKARVRSVHLQEHGHERGGKDRHRRRDCLGGRRSPPPHPSAGKIMLVVRQPRSSTKPKLQIAHGQLRRVRSRWTRGPSCWRARPQQAAAAQHPPDPQPRARRLKPGPLVFGEWSQGCASRHDIAPRPAHRSGRGLGFWPQLEGAGSAIGTFSRPLCPPIRGK